MKINRYWFLLAIGVPLSANGITTKTGVFLDTYYAYDFKKPAIPEREYTTTADRHNEFQVNLAFVEVVHQDDKTRGRLALQTGTSVVKNYSGEPQRGLSSGPLANRLIQEARAGIRMGEQLWLDAGIFYGNAGDESWESDKNWTYTRSLTADYSPYYSAGVKASWQATQRHSFELHVLNGWQIISDNNTAKMIGTRWNFQISPRWKVSHATLWGDERIPLGDRNLFRGFQNVMLSYESGASWRWRITFDAGVQERRSGQGADVWTAGNFISQYKKGRHAGSVRLEWYDDPSRANLITLGNPAFRVAGGSVGYDLEVSQAPLALWRTEFRALTHIDGDKIFPGRDGLTAYNYLLSTALTLRM